MNRHEGWCCLVLTAAALGFSPLTVDAKPAARNLGGGLEQLAQPAAAARRAAVSEVELINPIQFDDAGRALVRISLDGKVPAAAVIQSLQSTAGVEVTATDLNY